MRSRLALLAIWVLVSIVANSLAARSQAGAAVPVENPVNFDIPAQPLRSALDAYSVAAGLEVFYDSNLAAPRRSTAIRGVLPPDVALRVLLEGTGLKAIYSGSSFAVVPLESRRPASSPDGTGYGAYLALIQGRIEQAFCRRTETIPGEYRLALQFGIGRSGEVFNPRLLASTGDPRRDSIIVDLLRELTIEQSPPRTMPQPVTMVVSPRSPGQTGDCRSTETQPLRRAEP